MPAILVLLVVTTLAGCASYEGSEIWRRNACEQIADNDDRTRCQEDATRSENDYKQDVEDATKN